MTRSPHRDADRIKGNRFRLSDYREDFGGRDSRRVRQPGAGGSGIVRPVSLPGAAKVDERIDFASRLARTAPDAMDWPRSFGRLIELRDFAR